MLYCARIKKFKEYILGAMREERDIGISITGGLDVYLSGSAATYYCHCGMCGIDRCGKDNTLLSGMEVVVAMNLIESVG